MQERARSASPQTTRLHVGHLTRNVTEAHVREIFTTYGQIKVVDLVMDGRVNLPRGFAYVEFESRAEAEKAREHMDGGQIDGNVITWVHWRRWGCRGMLGARQGVHACMHSCGVLSLATMHSLLIVSDTQLAQERSSPAVVTCGWCCVLQQADTCICALCCSVQFVLQPRRARSPPPKAAPPPQRLPPPPVRDVRDARDVRDRERSPAGRRAASPRRDYRDNRDRCAAAACHTMSRQHRPQCMHYDACAASPGLQQQGLV